MVLALMAMHCRMVIEMIVIMGDMIAFSISSDATQKPSVSMMMLG